MIGLGQLGYAAIPQLVAALSDTRPSRGSKPSLYRGKVSYGEKIGGHAAVTLREISCRHFGSPPDPKKIEEWWVVARQKGELQMLSEATETGGPFEYDPSWRLVDKYPFQAAKPLSEGIRNAKEWSTKRRMIQLLGELKPKDSKSAIAALREVAQSDSDGMARLEAAHVLGWADLDFAISAMLKGLGEPSKLDRYYVEGDPWSRTVGFLIASGRPEAIRPFLNTLGGETIDRRIAFISVAGRALEKKPIPPTPAQAREYRLILEKILGSALSDKGWSPPQDGGIRYGPIQNPRVCDVAALAMATLWPDRYTWTYSPSPFQKDFYRVQVLNQWLAANGKPPEALPQRPKVAPLAPDVANALLNKLREAKTPDERLAALGQFEAHGQSAFPILLKEYEANPDRQDVGQAVRRVANRIREVKIVGDLTPEQKDALAPVLPKAGESLNPFILKALQEKVAKALRTTSEPLFSVVRENDGSGIVLTIDYGVSQQRGSGWAGNIKSVSIDGKSIFNRSGYAMNRAMIAPPGPTFADQLEKAFNANPLAVLEIYSSGANWAWY